MQAEFRAYSKRKAAFTVARTFQSLSSVLTRPAPGWGSATVLLRLRGEPKLQSGSLQHC